MSMQQIAQASYAPVLAGRMLAMPRGVVYAEYSTAAGQVYATGAGGLAICNYDTRVVDTHFAVTTGANWAFVLPFSGVYNLAHLNVFAGTTAWALAETALSYLYVDGVFNKVIDRWPGLDTSGGAEAIPIGRSTMVYGNKGQVLDVRLQQNTGGNLALANSAIYNWICIALVAAN